MRRSPFIFPSKTSPTNRIQESAAAPFSETLRLFQAAKCPKDVALNKKKRQFSPHMEELLQIPLTEQIKDIQATRSELYQKLEGTLRFDPAITEEAKRIDSEWITALAPLSSAFSSSEFFASKVLEIEQAKKQHPEEEEDLKKHPTPVPQRRRLTPMKFIRPAPGSRQNSDKTDESSDQRAKSAENKSNDSDAKKTEAELKKMSDLREQREQKEKDRKKRLIEKKRLMRQEMEARRRRMAERREARKSDDEGDSYNMSSPEDETSSIEVKEQWDQKNARPPQSISDDERSLRGDTSLERGLDGVAAELQKEGHSDSFPDEKAKDKNKDMDADDLSFVDNEDAIINDEFAEMERLTGIRFVDAYGKSMPAQEQLLANYGTIYGNGVIPGWACEDVGLGFGLNNPNGNEVSRKPGVGVCDYVVNGDRNKDLVVGNVYQLLEAGNSFSIAEKGQFDLMNASLNDPFVDIFCGVDDGRHSKNLCWALEGRNRGGKRVSEFKCSGEDVCGVDLTSAIIAGSNPYGAIECMGMDANDILMQRSVDLQVSETEDTLDAIQSLDFCTPDIVFRDGAIGRESAMLDSYLCADIPFKNDGTSQVSKTLMLGSEFNCTQSLALMNHAHALSGYFGPEEDDLSDVARKSREGTKPKQSCQSWQPSVGQSEGLYFGYNTFYPNERMALLDKEAFEQFNNDTMQHAMLGLEIIGNNDCPLIDRDVLLQFQSEHDELSKRDEPGKSKVEIWQSTFAVEPDEFILNAESFKCPEAVSPFARTEKGDEIEANDNSLRSRRQLAGLRIVTKNEDEESKTGKDICPADAFADKLADSYAAGFKCLDGFGTLHDGDVDKFKLPGHVTQVAVPKAEEETDNGYNTSGDGDDLDFGNNSLEEIFGLGREISKNLEGSVRSPRGPQKIRVRVKKRVPKKKDVATSVAPMLGGFTADGNDLGLRPVEDKPGHHQRRASPKGTHVEEGTQTILTGERQQRSGEASPPSRNYGKAEKVDKETLTPTSMRQRSYSRKVVHGDFKDLPSIPVPSPSKGTPESARTHKHDSMGSYGKQSTPQEKESKHKKTDETEGTRKRKPPIPLPPKSKESPGSAKLNNEENSTDSRHNKQSTPQGKDAKHKKTGDSNNEYEESPTVTRKRAESRKTVLENPKNLPPIPVPPKLKDSPESARATNEKSPSRVKKAKSKDKEQETNENKSQDQDKESISEKKRRSSVKESKANKQAEQSNEQSENSSPSVTRKRAHSRKVVSKDLPPIPLPPGAKGSPGSSRPQSPETSPDTKKKEESQEAETGKQSASPSPTRTRKRAATRKTVAGKELPPIPVPPASQNSPESARALRASDKIDNRRVKQVPKNEDEYYSSQSESDKENGSPSPGATRKRAASRKVVVGSGKQLPPVPIPPSAKDSPGSARAEIPEGSSKARRRQKLEEKERGVLLTDESSTHTEEAGEEEKQKRTTPRKRAQSRKVVAENLKQVPTIPVPSPTSTAGPNSARRNRKGDGESPEQRERRPRKVQFVEETVQPQKAPPLALPKVQHEAKEFEELEKFVANPWTHLHSSTQEGTGSDEEHLKLMRELSFVTDTTDQEADVKADAPIDYTIFYSSLAFPITMKYTTIKHLVETMTNMNITFQDCLTEAVNYIPDFLCPIKKSKIVFEKMATKKKRMFQSKEMPVQVTVTLDGSLQIQGTPVNPAEVEIKVTKNGFKLGKDQEYEMDPADVEQFLSLSKKPDLHMVLACLADGSDFAAKLIAPNLILALVLLNSPSFTFAMVRNLFQLFTRRERHNFLIRSLILAEISQTPVHLLFKRVTMYSKPLLVLFCAFSMPWADDVIGMLDSMKTVEPSKVLKVLIKACLQLPAESFYMIRILLTMLSFTMNDGCQIFSVFFAFLSLVISEVLKLRGQKSSPITTLMSQILLQLNSDARSSNRELLYLAPFLVRIFKRVPTLSYEEEDLGLILNFVKEHGDKLLAEIMKFGDQEKRQQIIAFSFAQNLRFLLNMRRQDTSKAITTT